ncbi:hypothetical protein FKW77_004203 [Venturia effusa]|uniref:Uncharacterized protein n=1 Tax=Venturia effusa TaxID=50376 RepID=A0A517LMN3_9PEZI|nr:hypothetical protein FKW77_004203 [Venturia effusa]
MQFSAFLLVVTSIGGTVAAPADAAAQTQDLAEVTGKCTSGFRYCGAWLNGLNQGYHLDYDSLYLCKPDHSVRKISRCLNQHCIDKPAAHCG